MIITTTPILEKFEQILVHISQEEKQKLARELAKIVPTQVSSLLDWRASWAYHFDTNQIEAKFHLKIQGFRASESNLLDEILPLFLINEYPLTEVEKTLDKFIMEGSVPYHLFCREVVFLEDNTAFLRFSFSAYCPHLQEKYEELATIQPRGI
jgi:hypothetical protein